MKIHPKVVVLCLAAGLTLLNASSRAETKVPVNNIAVMSLKAESGVEVSAGNLMTDMFRTALYETGRFGVMNREDMDSILKEIKFQQSGACDATACIVEMGQALGVDRMVAGSIGILGDSYVINGKLINVASARNEILATET